MLRTGTYGPTLSRGILFRFYGQTPLDQLPKRIEQAGLTDVTIIKLAGERLEFKATYNPSSAKSGRSALLEGLKVGAVLTTGVVLGGGFMVYQFQEAINKGWH